MQPLFMTKSLGETGDTKDISQYNENSLEEFHSHYKINGKKPIAIPGKSGKRQVGHSLHTYSIVYLRYWLEQ